MNIRFLETVIWLAHYRSFRQTADKLHITQAAISSRIAVIEQELGVRLFDRQPREVVLTEAGREFIAEARDIVRRYTAMVERHKASPAMQGPVRLGLSSSIAHLLLPEIATTLREQYPSVRLEVVTDDTGETLLRLLQSRQIDLCVTATRPAESSIFALCSVCTLGMAWVAKPGLLPQSNDRYSARDLSLFPVITYAQSTLNAERVRDFFGPHYANIPHLIVSNSLATSLQMAINGVGLTVLPLAVLRKEIQSSELEVVQTHPGYPSTSYAAVWTNNREDANAQGIIRLIESAAQKEALHHPPDVFYAEPHPAG